MVRAKWPHGMGGTALPDTWDLVLVEPLLGPRARSVDDATFPGSVLGEGMLLYPREEAGLSGLVALIRLKLIQEAVGESNWFP